MKQFKYLLLMLMALLSFSACESEDEEQESYDLYKYIKITDIRCERVGSVLRIDYKMKNVSGKKLSDIRLSSPRVKDNAGGDNYNNNKLAIRGGLFKPSLSFSLDKGEEADGTFIITDFDTSGEAKRVDLSFNAVIDSQNFSGQGGYNSLNIAEDTRVIRNGIQTNDKKLKYSDCSCMYQNGTAYLSFSVTAAEDINDFTLGNSIGGLEFNDDKGNPYYNMISMSINDGSYLYGTKTIYLRKKQSTKITVKIQDFKSNATEISTGYIEISSESYPMTDDRVRFFNIPVEK